MSPSVTPSFVLFGSALVLWSVAASLSGYLADDFSREHGKRKSASAGSMGAGSSSSGPASSAGTAEAPADLAALRKEVEANPKDPNVRVKLGYELVQRSQSEKDSSLLMEAVQVLGGALQLDPEHGDALLGLATLSLQAGVLDKALDLYPRYLKIEPDDLRARTDYALALVEARRFPEAEKELNEVLAKEPQSIPATMTFAYRYKVEGNVAEAKARADQALAVASDDETRLGIEAFVKALDAPVAPSAASSVAPSSSTSQDPHLHAAAHGDGHDHSTEHGHDHDHAHDGHSHTEDSHADHDHSAASSAAPAVGTGPTVGGQPATASTTASLTSPAVRVSEYFRNHTIVGPKLRGISWEGATIAVIKLDNFPVAEMPPYAKAQFLQRITDSFADFPEPVVIKMVDAATEQELLAVPVGPKAQ